MRERPAIGFPWRRRLVLAAMVLAAAALTGRAADLHLNRQAFLQSQGDARYLRAVDIPAHRGNILDRNGEPLAISTPVESVWADPSRLAAARSRWPALARILELDIETLAGLVEPRLGREFVYLKRQVTPASAARIRDLAVPGVHLQREYRRYYPLGEVAGHVTGFTNVDDAGQEGLELAYDERLRGTPGAKRVIRDRLGRIVAAVELIRAPQPGRDLGVSLDRRVQYLAYRALKAAVQRHAARGGVAVVLDAGTGEVLAMVNQPAYNPNNRADRVGSRYRNRAVTDVFEPGSAVKPFTIASALQTGRFSPETVVQTAPGFYRVGGHTIRDFRDYGRIDLATVIKKSSNVGATKVALAIPPERLWRTLRSVGLGRVTGSGFPGESAGILTHFADWGELRRATLSFGYGLSVTPLQLVQAYSVIAAGGRLHPVTFERVRGTASGTRVMSEEVALAVRTMLEAVVSEGGTGHRAAIDGYRVAGKTGTVRKPVSGGYAEDRYVAVFVGMAPASRPRLVGLVMLDEPRRRGYYGGEVAAPVFAEMVGGALRVLGIAPDAPSPGAGRMALAGGAGPAGGAATEARP